MMQQTKIGLVVLLLCLIQFTTASAQYDRRGYTLTADSDTVYWEKYIKTDEVKYGLEPIRNSTADFSFRLTWYGTSIDVYQNDSLAHGFINLFAEEYENGRNTGNTFKLTVTLRPEQAKDILSAIKESTIDNIPSEVHFQLSGHRTDGVIYNLEQKSGTTYSCKNYWSPESSSLNEFIIISNLIEEVQKISEYPALYERFRFVVPFDNFTNGSHMAGTKPLTMQYYKWLNKPAEQ